MAGYESEERLILDLPYAVDGEPTVNRIEYLKNLLPFG
jgi:hypothetical protein